MKKIIICVPSLAIGGAEKFAVDLAIQINKSEYNVIVAITRKKVDTFLKERLEKNKIRIADLSSDNFLEMLQKQVHFFKIEKPDVVHAQTGSILHIMLACMLCKIPLRLYTVHNEAKLLYGNSKLKKLIYKLAFIVFQFKIVAICETVKNTLINDMNINSEKILIVKNGVDVNRFIPTKKLHDKDEINLITVGRLCEIKNQVMTVRVVCKLRQLGYKVNFLILGDGDDREKIEEIIQKHNATDYIKLLGFKINVEDYLRQAEVYISSSKTEGLPLSILEAMASGLPIVATDAGGTRDIVLNNVNGFLIKIDDEVALQEAIVNLISNKQLIDDFSQESRVIAEVWSSENCTEGYENLYQNIKKEET